MVSGHSSATVVDGLLNLRDVGGLPTEDGGLTRRGRLLRSDSPHGLSDAGQRALLELGLRTVVDLRTVSERTHHPSRLADLPEVRSLHTPIFDDEDVFPEGLVTAADVYVWWLGARGTQVIAALSAIADSPSAPILVHCHAGKDRTGVVVALVLRLAGVGVETIADDYALSGVQLGAMLAKDRVSAVERGMDEVRAERLFTVRREAMIETVERTESEHGSVARLLARLGLDTPRIGRLKSLLLEPHWP